MNADSPTSPMDALPDTAHITGETLEEYLAHKLSPQGILRLHDHADLCSACREMLASAADAEAGHIGEQEAIDFVAGVAGTPEMEVHLAGCAECRARVDDLRELRAELQPVRTRQWQLAAAAALVITTGTGVWMIRSGATSHAVAQQPATPALTTALHDGPPVDGLPEDTRRLFAQALNEGVLPRPVAAVKPGAGTLRSQGMISVPPFSVESPSGTTESDRPLFRWSPLRGAVSYEVAVFDADLNPVARSGSVSGTEWRPEKPLPRRVALTWQVAAVSHGARVTAPSPPQPSASFEIISADATEMIATAKAAARPSHLLLAVLYAQNGLRDDAAAEIDRLAAANPQLKLIDSLRRSLE